MSLLDAAAFSYNSLLNEQNLSSQYIDFSAYGLNSGQLIAYQSPNLISVITGAGLSFDGLTLSATLASISGTVNQIIVTGTSSLVLSTPQDIASTSSPTFASLTLTGLTGVLKATAGVLSGSATTSDLPEGTNLYFTNARARTSIVTAIPLFIISGIISIGYMTSNLRLNGSNLDTIQDIASTSSPTFASLTLTGLTGVLKATAGVLSGSATTSDLPEGTNLYYTDTRARGAFSAGTGISIAAGVITNTAAITSVAGTANQIIVTGSGAITLSTPQDIASVSSPQFARLLNSSIGTSNILVGTSSGASLTSGGGNTLVGQGAGNNITSGTFNIGLGANAFGGSGAMTYMNAGNIAIGISSLFSCTGGAAHNTAVGFLALQSMTTGVGNIAMGNSCANNLLTGNNNVYIGQAITASSGSISSEGAINLTGSGIAGKGANTFFINAPSGFYSHNPAFYFGYFSAALVGNFIPSVLSSRAITSSVNLITLPYVGTYEICLSGTVISAAAPFAMYHFVGGVAYPYASINNVYYGSIVGYLPVSYTCFVTTTVPNTTTNFTYYTLTFGGINPAAPTFVTIKYVGL